MFVPSSAFVFLLYRDLAREVTIDARHAMVKFTKEQMATTVRSTLNESHDEIINDMMVVDGDGRFNPFFLQRVKRKIGQYLHARAGFDDCEFLLRFGEEFLLWVINDPEDAKCFGLSIINQSVFQSPTTFDSGIDVIGCA